MHSNDMLRASVQGKIDSSSEKDYDNKDGIREVMIR